jgi:hypothetical protein
MHEVRDALKALDFSVEAVLLTPADLTRLRVPAIILELRRKRSDNGMDEAKKPGHYVVLRPLDAENLQVLNYPLPHWQAPARDIADRMTAMPVGTIPALLCGARGQSLSDMLTPSSNRPATKPVVPISATRSTVISDKSVVLTDEMRRSPVVFCDLGDRAEGDVIEQRFRIENRTAKEIQIADLQKSCSCSELTALSDKIPPNGSTVVTMTTSLSQRFTEMRVDGVVRFNKGSGVPPALLIMRVVPHGRFYCVPPTIELGEYKSETGVAIRRMIVRPTEYAGAARLIKAVSKSPNVKVTLLPEGAADGSRTVEIAFDPTGVGGMFDGEIGFFGEKEELPVMKTGVRGVIEAKVGVNLRRLLITAEGSQAPTGVLSFRHWEKRALHLEVGTARIETSEGWKDEKNIAVVPSTEKIDPGNLTLKVTIADRLRKSPISGVLQIGIAAEGDSEKYQFAVPFFYSPKN